MKTALANSKQQRQHGLATLVVLVLLGIMSMLMVTNSRTLHQLQRELDLVERKQLQKFQPAGHSESKPSSAQ